MSDLNPAREGEAASFNTSAIAELIRNLRMSAESLGCRAMTVGFTFQNGALVHDQAGMTHEVLGLLRSQTLLAETKHTRNVVEAEVVLDNPGASA